MSHAHAPFVDRRPYRGMHSRLGLRPGAIACRAPPGGAGMAATTILDHFSVPNTQSQ
ncbi:MAG TPA: hypothetical protein VHB98_04620 [Chloroflexota bacterium]|jgi:hypothetical protein|nr:hypothetical protein [Chloroflexota bacterium]